MNLNNVQGHTGGWSRGRQSIQHGMGLNMPSQARSPLSPVTTRGNDDDNALQWLILNQPQHAVVENSKSKICYMLV